MNNKFKFFATATALLALTQAAPGVSVSWIGSAATDDWNDAGNWNTTHVPGATTIDNTIFSGAGDSNTPTADFVFVTAGTDLTARNEATITIGTGIDISGFDFFRLGANAGNGGGHVVMTGGSLSGDDFQIASSATATSRSSFTVSDGSLTTASGFSIGTLGDFNLTGDDATFGVDSFTASSGSVFNATFNATGISTVAATNAFTIGNATAALNLDFSAFSGTGTFDLVSFGTIGANTYSTVTGLGALSGGRTATIGYDADSMFVTIAVPEPGTYALLAGLTGLAFVMVRRRRV